MNRRRVISNHLENVICNSEQLKSYITLVLRSHEIREKWLMNEKDMDVELGYAKSN